MTTTRPFALRRCLLAATLVVLGATSSAWAQNDWCKSKWGPNDEIGAANLLTPQVAADAAKLVKTGKTYALGFETNSQTAAYAPRTWSITILQPGQAGGATLGPTKTTYNDDIITGWVGTGSQIDGLGHLGVDNVYFNCNKSAEFAQANGLKKLGVEKIPPFVTRGVVLDMAAYFGTPIVKEGTAFNRKEIDEQAKKQGIDIRKGDVVLFHTGWQDLEGKDNKRFLAGEPAWARTAPCTWRRKKWWRWARTSGRWKRFRLKKTAACLKFTRFCWRATASTFLKT
jgi:Putative cyclase